MPNKIWKDPGLRGNGLRYLSHLFLNVGKIQVISRSPFLDLFSENKSKSDLPHRDIKIE